VRPNLVVVGNGMAGMRTVEELLKLAPDRYRITVLGAEPRGNYNRVLLSAMLAGERTIDDILLHPVAWYAEQGIILRCADPVVAIDRRARRVRSRSGAEARYDRLLLATGSKPLVVPAPGAGLPGVVTFRDVDDVETMLAAAREYRRAVVIGGGLLGLEAAAGLRQRGMDVTIVQAADRLMERQLDSTAARLLRDALERRGLRFLLNAQTARIVGAGRVRAVELRDGQSLPADLVVMALGISPNAELAESAGLRSERGILVDDDLRTSDPNVYAVGECVRHRDKSYGLLSPLWEQAGVCAAQLAGIERTKYVGSVTAANLKVSGIDVFSAGDFVGGGDSEELVLSDRGRGVYKRLVLSGGRLQGAVLYGDVRDADWYSGLIRTGADVSHYRDRLVFGRAFVKEAA
jgi:nitrite reductase (NADH) large subunit